MIWQPEFTDKTLSRKPGAVHGAALINFVDGRVTDGFILREGEFVTSLQALKEIGIKAGFSAFAEE
ncbi:hypothetical protein [Escherichia coli]|uniref:hypothetical protein n=1 Tax=Escherichia coli TaxID=562 RepID=UPI0019E5C58D|nr:hypothetical protein [Escherichia coli]NJZ61353.1 hypothetical protein [Escherichia coli]